MFKPKHQQLYELLCEELGNGKWPCDEKLPNLKELAASYHVSINVVSKAVDLLKENDLVTAKVGDGIYSRTSGISALSEFKYSGDRLFGRYGGAKEIRILVEDSADWQLAFWNAFFDEIARDNPDIELKVSYKPSEHQVLEFYDLALGSVEYLSTRGFAPDRLFAFSDLQEFYGDLYRSVLLRPEQFSWRNISGYLPFGVEYYHLLTADEVEAPLASENILDYIERLSAASASPVGYCIHNSRAFLKNSGLQFVDWQTGKFRMPEKSLLLEVFQRSRRLMRKGHLIWFHGKFSDYGQLSRLTENQPVRILEMFLNQRGEKSASGQKTQILPYPSGQSPSLVPEVAGISRNTLFPEECLRVLKKLLSQKTQQKMQRQKIAAAIHPQVLQDSALREGLSRYQLDDLSLPEPRMVTALRYFVGWEFFYYLQGRRQQEVAELIQKKMEFYLKQVEKNTLQCE